MPQRREWLGWSCQRGRLSPMWEKILSLIETLAETEFLTFLLLFGIGALLLATGATGGWPQVKVVVSEPLWRYFIAACGFILMFAAVVFAFVERTSLKSKSIDKKKAGVSIDYPSEGDRVTVPSAVTGKCKNPPKGTQLWLFMVPGEGKGLRYYPQDQIRIRDDHSWRAELRATTYKDGDRRRFAIFLVGENGQALIHHFKTAGDAINAIEPKSSVRPWPGISLLTSDIVQATDTREVTLSRAP